MAEAVGDLGAGVSREWVWITWEKQQRNRSMSRVFECELHEIISNRARILRYLVSGARTIRILLSRPKLVFVQNPSAVLALLGVVVGRLLRVPIVVDAHNAALIPLEGTSPRLMRLVARFLVRGAALTLVTNEALAEIVRREGGAVEVLPDPFPEITCGDPYDYPDSEVSVFCVLSWADDEPFVEIMGAAAELGPNVRVYMTGSSKGRERVYGRSLPENVVLLGYVDDAEYRRRLCGADLVVVLTTRDNCLVCGAYEAVAAGRPLMLSDTEALREYFRDTAFYVKNDASSIASGISRFVKWMHDRPMDSGSERSEITRRWQMHKAHVDVRLKAIIKAV